MRPAGAIILAVLLLTPVLAGCLDQATDLEPDATDLDAVLSQPIIEEFLKENVRVASYDGVELDNWVFRPDTDEPVPVIINFSPYWGNLAPAAETGGDAFGLWLIEYMVPRGYAVVLSSARGTGASDGCFTIGGPGELEDMAAVIDHFAAADWSNGRVGAAGKSYDGTMPQGIAVLGHPALKAIYPTSPISEFYKYNYMNGVPYAGQGPLFNHYYQTGVGWGVYPLLDGDTSGLAALTAGDLTCEDNAEVHASQQEGHLLGTYSGYWQARNYSAMADGIASDLGIFYVHGLEDWNVKPDHMWPWFQDIPEDVYVLKWLGHHGHDYPHRDDHNETTLRFFDHFLKGIDTGLLEEPRARVQGDDGVWRIEEDWPPERATDEVLHLAPNLPTEAPDAATRTFDDGPFGMGAYFTSDTLQEPLRYAGVPSVRLDLSHTAAKGTVSVTLFDVDGGGQRKVINQGFFDFRQRNGLDQSVPVTPGERFVLDFALYPQDDIIPQGHRVGVLVSATNLDGAPVQVQTVPSGGMTTLYLGEDTLLRLPVVDMDADVVESPQPVDLGCWLC